MQCFHNEEMNRTFHNFFSENSHRNENFFWNWKHILKKPVLSLYIHYYTIVATIIPLHSLLFLHFHHYPLVHSYSLPSTIILINPTIILINPKVFNFIHLHSILSLLTQNYPYVFNITHYPAFNIIPLHSTLSLCNQHYHFVFNIIHLYSILSLCIQHYPFVFNIIPLHSTLSIYIHDYPIVFNIISLHQLIPPYA